MADASAAAGQQQMASGFTLTTFNPRKTHPHLALSLDNLQVLCEDCNCGKGSWDSTDWRAKMG